MTLHYTFQDLHPYINWIYFYHAWQLRQPEQQQNLRREAEQFLADVAERYRAHAIFLIVPAHSDGDDIVIEGNAFTLPMLRQQTGHLTYASPTLLPQAASPVYACPMVNGQWSTVILVSSPPAWTRAWSMILTMTLTRR